MVEWRDIRGYEGLYQISSDGKVRSLDHYSHCKGDKWRLFKGCELKPRKDRCGYMYVGLRKSGHSQKFMKIHRLVAEAFIDNADNKPQVNHLNEIKDDNRAENLEWVTAKENINYGNGNIRRRNSNLDQKNHAKHIKLQNNDGEILMFPSLASAARYLNCTTSLISCALHKRGRSKKAKGYNVSLI